MRRAGGCERRYAPAYARSSSRRHGPMWICAAADGHIQATGRDVRAQTAHIAEYREAREQSIWHLFALRVPAIRATSDT